MHQSGALCDIPTNMKFVRSILWPGGAYTDAAYADDARIMIPYSDEIMNHDNIGSLGCIPNEPTRKCGLQANHSENATIVRSIFSDTIVPQMCMDEPKTSNTNCLLIPGKNPSL